MEGIQRNMHNYFRNVKRKNVSNPDFVVLTHWHWDHIFGLSVLQNALTISHAETKKKCSQ